MSIRKIQEISFCLLFLVLPFDKLAGAIHVGSFPLTLSTIIVLFIVFTFIIRLFDQCQPAVLSKKAFFPFLLLIIVFGIDILAIPRSEGGEFQAIESLSAAIVFGLAAVIVYQNPNVFKGALHVWTAVIVVGSILAAVQTMGYSLWSEPAKPLHIGALKMPFKRTIGLPVDYGLYGILNFGVLPLVIISVINKKGLYRSRLIAMGVSLLILLGIFIGQSRSMWLGLVLALAVLLISSGYHLRKKKPFFFILIISGMIFFCFLGMRSVQGIGIDVYKARPNSVNVRLHQYHTAVQIVLSHPLTGIGYGNFAEYYEPLSKKKDHSAGVWKLHNYFLNKAVSAGLMGAALLILIFAWVAHTLWRDASRYIKEPTGWFMLGLLSGLTGMMVELMLFPGGSGLKILWAYLGMIVGFSGAKRRAESLAGRYE